MARVLVVGAGIVGSSFALLAANDAHEVIVLERDAAPPPANAEDAWDNWERRGVNQFRLLHYFLARFRQIVTTELPEVVAALDADGALRINPFATIPDTLSGGWRPDDDRFEALTGRRPMVEAAFARVVAASANITVRRGTAVRALLVDRQVQANGIPRVDGVVTEDGEELRADLVVDAGGRRSALPSWLDVIGARLPVEEKDDCGFIYYGRYFRSSDGSIPFAFGPPLQHYASFSTLTLPADNGTWGVGVVTSAHDPAARALSKDDTWERVVRGCPLVAHWLDGTSMQSVAVMARIEDRIRNFIVDGEPVVTGVVAVGDAWACTNPSVGRGATIGMIHAVALRDLLREREPGRNPDDAIAFAHRWAEVTATTVEPFVRDTLSFDRHRLAEIEAQIAGLDYVTDDESWITGHAITNGTGQNPELLRGAVDLANLLASPAEVLARPGVAEAIVPFVGRAAELPPGPTRAEFLQLLASGI